MLGWFAVRLEQLVAGDADKDAKTRLQEYLQGRGSPLPEYELVGVAGDDHDQQFSVACRLARPQLVVRAAVKSAQRPSRPPPWMR